MKHLKLILVLTSIFVIFNSCEKDDPTPKIDENGLTPEINTLISEENRNALFDLGFEINGGGNPPDINNEYVISPCFISQSSAGDIPGSTCPDFFIKLYDQDEYNITVDYRHGTQIGEAIGSYIVGEDCKFSVFIEVNEINTTSGSEAKLVLGVSGRLVNGGIEEIKIANLMLDNFGNSGNIWIENGTGRLFRDQDDFSEVVGGQSFWYSKLPDCPCEYSEDIDGQEEMCGEWEDFTDGCFGISFLEDFHFGAKYELRWAKDEDSPGQQCTYDANKKLITNGIAAGTPDKFGVVDPCNPNSDHNSADVEPWKEISCYLYLTQWKPNQGENCQQNIVNGIEHLQVMLGTMNCEKVTAIFKMIGSSQNATQELKDYIEGKLNYTPTNLKNNLVEIFNEYDCSNNLNETNCSALQEAIDNL